MIVNQTLNESVDYALSIRNLKRQIESNRPAIEAFKQESYGHTLKEATTSDELRPFVAQVFADEIIQLGLREAHARNLFPVSGQTSNDSFKQRFRYKSSGASILRELDEIKHSKSALKSETFTFSKLLESNLISWEALADFPLNTSVDEVTHATSNIYRRENQLMWDNITRFTQGDKADEWNTWIDGPNVCDGSAGTDTESQAELLLDAMQEAYLSMTTALTDRFDPSGLHWGWSSEVHAILWRSPTFRQYQLGGQVPLQLTGNLPQPFGIPFKIIEPGYWTQGTNNSEFVHTPCDIYLFAPAAAAGIRERVGLRLDGLTKDLIQASGSVLWERISCYTRHPKAMRRISPNSDYADQISDPADIVVRVKDEA